MILAYLITFLISLAVYFFMGSVNMRLRIGISLCLFIFLAAAVTWYVVRVGDMARPGSVEIPLEGIDRSSTAIGSQ